MGVAHNPFMKGDFMDFVHNPSDRVLLGVAHKLPLKRGLMGLHATPSKGD